MIYNVNPDDHRFCPRSFLLRKQKTVLLFTSASGLHHRAALYPTTASLQHIAVSSESP